MIFRFRCARAYGLASPSYRWGWSVIRSFEEYVREGIVEERSPDLPRSRDLRLDASNSFESIVSIRDAVGVSDALANAIVKLAYDAVMSAIRSHMVSCGYHASGRGAHEAEVAYLRVLGVSDADVDFCDRLRYYRNGIMYYGKRFDAHYAESVVLFASRMLAVLDREDSL